MSCKEAQNLQKIRRRPLGFLCLVVALTSVSVVGQVASPSPPSPSSKVGKITGRVVNQSGQPLPKATVVIQAVGSRMSNQTTFTDQDGKFEFSGLDRVNYQLFARLSAYAPLPRDPSIQSTNVRVGDSVTLVLTKGGVITGTVTTQDGEPLVGIRVYTQMVRDNELLPWPYGQMPSERLTDDRGIYRIYSLPAGTYLVWAGGVGSNPVMDPFYIDVPTYSPSSTRDTAAEITVRAGEETTHVDIRYRGEPGHTVSGSITGPETGDIRSVIDLTSARDGGALWGALRSIPSETSGGFAFHGIDDGDYYITARSFLPSQEWAISASKRISVRGADVTGIELVTRPLGSVNGRVVLEESSATECKDKERPVFSETLVSARHRESEATKEVPRFIWSLGAPANPDAEGNVALRNLAPGDYRFVAQFSGEYWYLNSISLATSKTKPVNAARAWTTIKSGDRLSGLTVTLTQGAASLRGQMVLEEGETLPERLFAYLVPAEREKSDEVLRYFTAPVTPDGKIVLNNIAPGRYWILAQPAVSSGSPPVTQIRLPDATEFRSRLRRDAEAKKNEIELKPCQNVVDFRVNL